MGPAGIKRFNCFRQVSPVCCLFIVCFIGILLCKPAASAETKFPSSPKGKAAIGEYFDGEEFTYNIGFLWFKKAAIGRIGIYKQEKGLYKITLQIGRASCRERV